jgi:hypothetical protein
LHREAVPVRLLFVIEATQETLRAILAGNAVIRRMVDNRWVQLAAIDPADGRIAVYHDGAFEPHVPSPGSLPVAASSRDWYAGWREHLEFAAIGSPGSPNGP